MGALQPTLQSPSPIFVFYNRPIRIQDAVARLIQKLRGGLDDSPADFIALQSAVQEKMTVFRRDDERGIRNDEVKCFSSYRLEHIPFAKFNVGDSVQIRIES